MTSSKGRRWFFYAPPSGNVENHRVVEARTAWDAWKACVTLCLTSDVIGVASSHLLSVQSSRDGSRSFAFLPA